MLMSPSASKFGHAEVCSIGTDGSAFIATEVWIKTPQLSTISFLELNVRNWESKKALGLTPVLVVSPVISEKVQGRYVIRA